MRELQSVEINQVNGGILGFAYAAYQGAQHSGYLSTIAISTLIDTCIFTYNTARTPGIGGFALLYIPQNFLSALILDTIGYSIANSLAGQKSDSNKEDFK